MKTWLLGLFGQAQPVVDTARSPLIGRHNRQNMLAAVQRIADELLIF